MEDKHKYICIHGHFYQPPRENAWLETVELQDSAAPFHDWNARINFECYAPNTAARILNNHQDIIKIVNNYTRISHNFGPTLLSWMEKEDKETYDNIIAADKISQDVFGGHGSALAQVHSHLILPLASRRDKETQVIWGIQDFVYRYGRKPEGIWLAETAADTETLEVLVENGIKFTILAPRQAKAFRKIGDNHWHQLGHAAVDPRRPYLCKLPSGKSISLFFYDGEVAKGVAFEGLLNNGQAFANRLLGAFDEGNNSPQLVHIATDGESYGHHHQYGEMALASCLYHIEEHSGATLVNYAQYLELFPPEYEIEIHENSSWSCVHGVERWRSNCGCQGGRGHGWTQTWRKPLREMLNWLRDELIPIYEKEAGPLLKDVWQARNEYIEVLLRRTNEQVQEFIEENANYALSKKEEIKLLRLMELQRNTLLMFTSCGWFFDEISDIETNQILQYANRAIYYAKQVSGVDLHPEFLQRLENTPSNVFENGAVSYRKNVMPARVDLSRVGMHYAAASLFEKDVNKMELFNYTASNEVFESIRAGTQRMAVGRTIVRSKITHSEKLFSFAVFYLGQQNIIGNISLRLDRTTFDEMHSKILDAFRSADLGQAIVIMEEYFFNDRFTIWHLFRDEKRKILEQVTRRSLQQADSVFRDIYNDNYQLMNGMRQSDIPIPKPYLSAVEYVVNKDLHQYFEQDFLFIRELKRLVRELAKWDIKFSDKASFTLTASERLYYEIRKLANSKVTVEELRNLNTILETLQLMEIELDIWKSQNIYFSMMKELVEEKREFVGEEWKQEFEKLGKLLKMKSMF